MVTRQFCVYMLSQEKFLYTYRKMYDHFFSSCKISVYLKIANYRTFSGVITRPQSYNICKRSMSTEYKCVILEFSSISHLREAREKLHGFAIIFLLLSTFLNSTLFLHFLFLILSGLTFHC